MSHSPSALHAHCEDCGSPLVGPFCSQCGQHDVNYRGSFAHILEDAIEGAAHFDGRFFKSVRLLFSRPGFLTTEFLAGKRTRYIHPVRFYVLASFLFFSFTFLVGHRKESAPPPQVSAPVPAPTPPVVKTPAAASPFLSFQTRPTEKNQSWLDNPLQVQVSGKHAAEDNEIVKEFWHLVPEGLILCVPFLALVIKLVHVRSGRPYLDHIIFALHLEVLAFLSFIVIKSGGMLAGRVSVQCEDWVGAVLMLGLIILIFRAFRSVYGGSWIKTLFGISAVFLGYLVVLIGAVAGLLAASVYLVSGSL